MTKHDRYLRLVAWARKRYMVNGWVTLSTGGKPSLYSRIEDMAAVKLLGCTTHW